MTCVSRCTYGGSSYNMRSNVRRGRQMIKDISDIRVRLAGAKGARRLFGGRKTTRGACRLARSEKGSGGRAILSYVTRNYLRLNRSLDTDGGRRLANRGFYGLNANYSYGTYGCAREGKRCEEGRKRRRQP